MTSLNHVGAAPERRVVADAASASMADPGGHGMPREWVAELTARGPARDVALSELHLLMVRAANHQVLRMRSQLPGFGAQQCHDLAMAAADDAMVACLAKLHTFEGRSRFTTWAYKFAILQAATEVRRQAWAFREVPLEDAGTGQRQGTGPGAGPEQYAEARDLATAAARGLDVALTAHQRRIAVALLIDNVPIDVLADRLGTTRGSLYKTLHDARSRLRAHLVASGHLDPLGSQEDPS
jgi:RNA polymerase sigma-70 factor (ECF subfamily)